MRGREKTNCHKGNRSENIWQLFDVMIVFVVVCQHNRGNRGMTKIQTGISSLNNYVNVVVVPVEGKETHCLVHYLLMRTLTNDLLLSLSPVWLLWGRLTED